MERGCRSGHCVRPSRQGRRSRCPTCESALRAARIFSAMTKRLLVCAVVTAIGSASHAQKAALTPMVTIPAGKLIRNATGLNGEPVELEISEFRIDQDEVTHRQYSACVKTKRCQPSKVRVRGWDLDEPVRG